MFKRAIVGVDGTKASFIASEYAFDLGSKLNIPVIGLYAFDPKIVEESFLADLSGILGFSFYAGISQKVKDFLEEASTTFLDEFSSLGRSFGAKPSVMKAWGDPAKLILDQADEEDIIFLGNIFHSKNHPEEKPIHTIKFSSVSEEVIKKSKCPVFMGGDSYSPINKIMCLIGTKEDFLVIQKALKLKEIYRSSLEFFHFYEINENKDLSNEIKDKFGVNLNNVRGIPETKALELSEDFDLIIMGSHRKKVLDFFIGSTTSFVVQNSKKPVLIIK